jgi:hypothetical protein
MRFDGAFQIGDALVNRGMPDLPFLVQFAAAATPLTVETALHFKHCDPVLDRSVFELFNMQ